MYKVGDRIGGLTVVEYLGHLLNHPETGKDYSYKKHWYRMQCNCGAFEVISQPQLKTRSCCIDCTRELIAEKRRRDNELKRMNRELQKKLDDTPNEVMQALNRRWA